MLGSPWSLRESFHGRAKRDSWWKVGARLRPCHARSWLSRNPTGWAGAEMTWTSLSWNSEVLGKGQMNRRIVQHKPIISGQNKQINFLGRSQINHEIHSCYLQILVTKTPLQSLSTRNALPSGSQEIADSLPSRAASLRILWSFQGNCSYLISPCWWDGNLSVPSLLKGLLAIFSRGVAFVYVELNFVWGKLQPTSKKRRLSSQWPAGLI